MTLRDASLLVGGAGEFLPSATQTHIAGNPGYVISLPGTATAVVYKYKNRGWYVAGGVEESWVTVGAPSTVPPSGHTLIGIDYVVLQP